MSDETVSTVFGEAVASELGAVQTAAPKTVKKATKAAPVEALIDGERSDTDIIMEQNAMMRTAKRIKIRLEHSDAIPPTGQFIGVNGVGYLLLPNAEVEVPEFLLDALDNAVESVPVRNEQGAVVGYQQRTRLPYTIVRK